MRFSSLKLEASSPLCYKAPCLLVYLEGSWWSQCIGVSSWGDRWEERAPEKCSPFGLLGWQSYHSNIVSIVLLQVLEMFTGLDEWKPRQWFFYAYNFGDAISGESDLGSNISHTTHCFYNKGQVTYPPASVSHLKKIEITKHTHEDNIMNAMRGKGHMANTQQMFILILERINWTCLCATSCISLS